MLCHAMGLSQPPAKKGSTAGYQHPHWFVNSEQPASYWDYENASITYNSIAPYELLYKVGCGKYSEVFRAQHRRTGQLCIVKILKPVRMKKIKREIVILRHLCGAPNVVTLLDIVRDKTTDTPALVTELVENATTFRSLMASRRLSNFDMRYYLYEILRTLQYVHARGIFHRDLKPYNIMIDHGKKKLRIIDWGLAEFYRHGEVLNCGVATRHYKPPELLVGYRRYDYSLDMWCLGCILAAMLFQIDPFFCGRDNDDQLTQIVEVFGSAELVQYVNKYSLHVSRSVHEKMANSVPKQLWSSLAAKKGTSWCDRESLDLLDRLLQFDHQRRITAEDAMAHPFFASVRAELKKDPHEGYPHPAPVRE